MKPIIVPYGSDESIIAPDPRWEEVVKHHYRLDDPEYDYQELIELSLRYLKDNKPTADWRIKRVKDALMKLPHTPRFFREPQFWPRLEEALHDPGVNRMFQEEVTDGLHSEFLASSYVLMPSAVTLEMPFQHCINLTLEMAEVTPSDPYHRISLVEEGYQYTRVRTATTVEVLIRALRQKDLHKVLVMNCGRLLEFRYFPELQDLILRSDAVFYLNDTDSTLSLEELIPDPEYRKHFRFATMTNSATLQSLPDESVDMAISMGHAIYSYSYNPNGATLHDMFSYGYLSNDIVKNSLRVLKPGRKLMFDLQPMSLEWQKLLLSLTWLRDKGMNIALPQETQLVMFMELLLSEHSFDSARAYAVAVKSEKRLDTAGFYIVITK